MFTAPSNILVGYFAVIPVVDTNQIDLISLMVSSCLLYIAGIVFNDYFDAEVDRRERPFRPIPSGSISKRQALIIASTVLTAANLVAFLVSPQSLLVSLALTGVIIAYDSRLKRGFAGPFAMATTRFLNVLLGASPALALVLGGTARPGTVLFAAGMLFAYIIAIMILSKKEVGNQRPNIYAAFVAVFAIISLIAITGLFLQFDVIFLANLLMFTAVMLFTFWQLAKEKTVQVAIRNMVISIIILDSVFVAGTAGLLYGFATLLLIVPAVLLSRKLYVT